MDIDTRKKIESCIIFNQLIVVLKFVIMAIEDKKIKKQMIKMFCEKYNKLIRINDNEYLMKKFKEERLQRIEKLIKKENIFKIMVYLFIKR